MKYIRIILCLSCFLHLSIGYSNVRIQSLEQEFYYANNLYNAKKYREAGRIYTRIEKEMPIDFKYAGMIYNTLGCMYADGLGTRKDMKKAFHFFQDAYKTGFNWGKYNYALWMARGDIDEGGWKSDVPTALNICLELLNDERVEYSELGMRWLKTFVEDAYRLKYFRAFLPYVGQVYRIMADASCFGCFVTKEKDSDILRWYQESSRLGDVAGLFGYAYCLENGIGCRVDLKTAINLYSDLCNEHDYAEAYGELGDCYECGRGVPKDYEKAFRLYEMARKRGSSVGCASLAWCYEKGKGTRRDLERALTLYEQAYEMGWRSFTREDSLVEIDAEKKIKELRSMLGLGSEVRKGNLSKWTNGDVEQPSLIEESNAQDERIQTNSSVDMEDFRAEMLHRSHNNGHLGVRGIILGCPECDEARQQNESQQEVFDEQKREANRRGENGVWAQNQQRANDEMATRAVLRMWKEVKKGRQAPTRVFNIKPAVADPMHPATCLPSIRKY